MLATFSVAALTFRSVLHFEKLGYATPDMIATIAITTSNSKIVKPLMS
jgi:hypothetical protein